MKFHFLLPILPDAPPAVEFLARNFPMGASGLLSNSLLFRMIKSIAKSRGA
ncbi:MAG: hypothetical protein K8T89_18950 [Planctomycetes bacterium]|nr:hypothetical protein [Planctomycetota bacterium]